MIDEPQHPLGWIQHPVRACLHGTTAIVSVFGAVILCRQASGDLGRQLCFLIFGMSLVALYSVSSLYHGVPWSAAWKGRMQRLDHSMIYVLIAGTYTPIAGVAMEGRERALALAVVWGIAFFGGMQKALIPHLPAALSITLQMIQGWLGILFLAPLSRVLPPPALMLMVGGGMLYTVGMIAFVTRRPRLWPRVFSYHEVFHVLIVAGSAAHYAMILRYVARLGIV